MVEILPSMLRTTWRKYFCIENLYTFLPYALKKSSDDENNYFTFAKTGLVFCSARVLRCGFEFFHLFLCVWVFYAYAKSMYFYAYACVCVYTPCTCIAFRGQGREPDPLHLELWAPSRCWESNPDPLEEWPVFLTTELSLLPLSLKIFWFFF